MTDLPLHVISETSKVIVLGWTPVPCVGYVFYKDGIRVSNTWDPTVNQIKFGKGQTYRVDALGVNATGAYPNIVPPPSGVPIDTGGQSNITIKDTSIQIPPEFQDYNKACIYVSGPSQNIHIGPNVQLQGGYLCVKQYCSTWGTCKNLVIDGGAYTGAGGDLIHLDGVSGATIDNVRLTNPVNQGLEHHDGIQIESGENITIGPGVYIGWQTTPRTDQPNNGMFINWGGNPSRPLRNVTVDRVTIDRWWGGRALQMGVSGKIINPNIIDSGAGPQSPPITCWAPKDGGKIEFHQVDRSSVYFNDYSGSGWPSYAIVIP